MVSDTPTGIDGSEWNGAQGLLLHLVWRFSGPIRQLGLSREDVAADCNYRLLKDLHKYDPFRLTWREVKGCWRAYRTSFRTWAYRVIWGDIHNYLEAESRRKVREKAVSVSGNRV